MQPFLISVFLTAGICVWVYNQLQRRSGNNTEQSAIATAVVAMIMLLIFYTALGLFL
jgi:ABC-type nickel/cobalt efflux system permease component RcnA